MLSVIPVQHNEVCLCKEKQMEGCAGCAGIMFWFSMVFVEVTTIMVRWGSSKQDQYRQMHAVNFDAKKACRSRSSHKREID